VKILAVSDMVLDRLYSIDLAQHLRGVGLILACGDLPYEYLEYLITAINVPLLYVPGNHDPEFDPRNPAARADGCEFIDRNVVRVKGYSIGGLGGSIRYKPGHPNQYTQTEMYWRVGSFAPKLALHLLRYGGVLDFMIAHSPPFGIHDDDDQAHIGFSAFNDLIRIFKPRYFLHGHTMVYKSNLVPPVSKVDNTTVINIYPYRVIEVD
jgi:Icc-related predicted phosphoesterase